MKRQLYLVAAAATLLAVAESSAVAWRVPQQTLAAMDVVFGAQTVPQPTPAPAGPMLGKRQTNREQTCGFLSGALDDPVACPNGASCVVNTAASLVGCCSAGDCKVPATCLPQASSALAAQGNAAQTLYCSDDAAPACATLVYLDPDFLGHSGYFCDASSTQYAVYYSAFAGGSTPAATAATATGKGKGVTATGGATGTAGGNGGSGGNGNGGNGSGGNSSGPPIGAIVGGVVGGVAVLALLATGLFLLLRRSRKQRYVPTPQAPPPNDPFSHPPPPAPYMAQQQHLSPGLYGVPANKTSYDGSTIVAAASVAPSPARTPSPAGLHRPPPPEGYDSAVPYGPDYVGLAPYSDRPAAAELGAVPQERPVSELAAAPRERPVSELPVGRGHGELRELA